MKINNKPKYVYLVNGRWVYRPRLKASEFSPDIIDSRGFLKPPYGLGKKGITESQLYSEYLKACKILESFKDPDKNTLFWLHDKYTNSAQFKKLDPDTSQSRYIQASAILQHEIKINDKHFKIGELQCSFFNGKKPFIRRLLERRLELRLEKGQDGKSTVNYERAYLSTMFNWGINYLDNLGLQLNPIQGVNKFKENIRDRYVTDEEYQLQYDLAGKFCPYLQPFYELSYLCAQRSIEARNLMKSDILEEGILIDRRKGSKTNIIKWSKRLKAAVKQALALHKQSKIISMEDTHLLVNTQGYRIRRSALNSACGRLRKFIKDSGMKHEYWAPHDLKRKGLSDAKNKNIAGHKTEQMKQRYNVKIDSIKPAK